MMSETRDSTTTSRGVPRPDLFSTHSVSMSSLKHGENSRRRPSSSPAVHHEPTHAGSSTGPVRSPRTAAFFDDPSPSPAPAPRLEPPLLPFNPPLSPSPFNLSREPSYRPPPLSPLRMPEDPSIAQSWTPPAEDVKLRFFARSTYLLGEGRYAKVYLASYKDDHRDETWKLCAAKLMASDRDSQTMGLREAFFLSRLTAGTRRRALSPLGRDFDPKSGKVYVIKLIAVKEEEGERRSSSGGHTRSSSLANGRALQRKRSSTLGMGALSLDDNESSLSSFPSLPELAQSSRMDAQPSLSRLVLLLEHAPLGTLDRFLRTSPALVGKELWERWAREGTEALHWIHHQGVVHADVKPGNLLLTSDFHLRLSDFGSSLLIQPSQPPTDGLGLGTLPFSAPELVDSSRSFSFPVDIFAFGATLYQCLTGREPYRGVRTMEMMHHVRRGGLWAWEERARISKIGEEDLSIEPSPYPSAWRGIPSEGVRRGGSLRVPREASPSTVKRRPRLGRMSSTESLQASEELLDASSESPAGIKLWARWITRPSTPSTDAISALLADPPDSPVEPHRARPSLDIPSPTVPSPLSASRFDSPIEPQGEAIGSLPPLSSYEDGSPVMTFLDGDDLVHDSIRQSIRRMVEPSPTDRPTASELRRIWRDLGVGVEIDM